VPMAPERPRSTRRASRTCLLPYADRLAVNGVNLNGSMAMRLGELAAVLGRHAEADGHFAVAAEVHKRIGAPVFLARTRLAWASSLLAQGSALAAMRARRLLEQAAADARARSRRRDAPDRGGAQPGRRHRGRASRGLRRWDQVPPHARGTGTIGAEVIGRLPGLA
jgi:hypothetical protein